MKSLQSPDSVHSRSQLLFMSEGMSQWLQAVLDIGEAARGVLQPMECISIGSDVGQTALRLLTDMALHTWKEAG